MEHRFGKHIKEQLHTEIIIKTKVEATVPSTAYVNIEVDSSHMEQETGSVEFVKSEPALLVKDEILEDSMQDLKDGNYHFDKSMKIFQSNRVFETNCKDMHGTEQYKCEECNRVFKSMSYLQNHISRVHNALQYECDICKEIFHSMEAVRRHILAHHRFQDVSYKCEKGLKIYKSKGKLMKHSQQLHGNESHMCTECNEAFKCKASLQVHVNYAHSKQQSECGVCKKVYKSKQSLIYHLKVVHKLKPAGSGACIYTCNHCQKTFWTKSALRQHIHSVHGERIHQCQMCDKIYKCRNHLQRHITITHGKAQHECEVCHNLFTARYILKTHIKKVHGLGNIQSTSVLHSQEVDDPRPTMGDMSAVVGASAQHYNVGAVKSEPADTELELGPVMFQHMDSNYRPYKEPQ